MYLNMDADLMARQRDIANNLETGEALRVFSPELVHSLFPSDLEAEQWPVPARINFEEEGTKDLGDLRALPNEIMDLIIKKLDLPSAISFSYVSRTANVLIQQSPVPFLKQWAPDMPKFLRNSYIQREWSIAQIKATLRCSQCVSCGESCSRIFLATMERVCQPCMQYNHAYWCLPIQQAAITFGLPAIEVTKLTPIYIPGLSVRNLGSRDQSAWVVPIKVALAKGLELYGTRDAIRRHVEAYSPRPDTLQGGSDPNEETFTIRSHLDIYRSASLDPLTPAELRSPLVTKYPHVHVHSAGISIRTFVVPYGNTRKIMRSCRGCAAMITHPNLALLNTRQMQMLRLDPNLTSLERGVVLFRRAFRVWELPELLDHLRNECLGGWALMHAGSSGEQ
ncbi:hypothetical protein N7457_005838 [Penicillium paradoxum]|uniref:uncharacterized protein n=1 Tax=Penicillium paradoxum TaxID=176176 RepID=UPI0025478C65|nr:uncharacterized protein N7457_005838 [Penicillium paradoxum]KAJ5780678.1 hypothetical protein N7457_005838 [Penicillium paradoxum]